MKNTLSEKDKIGDKLTEEEMKQAKDAVEKAKEWLEANPEATKEEIEENKKEMEDIVTPIISKLYKAGYKPNKPGEEGSKEESTDDSEYGHDEL